MHDIHIAVFVLLFLPENPRGGLLLLPSSLPSSPLLIGSTYYTGATYQFSNGGILWSYSLVDNSYTILHYFNSTHVNDGANPSSPPIEVNGKLYGVTYNGGFYGKGILYSFVLATRTIQVLYSFGSPNITNPNSDVPAFDGGFPIASPVYNTLDFYFYGVCYGGSNNYAGTIYRFKLAEGNISAIYRQLYQFLDNPNNPEIDGTQPSGSIVFNPEQTMLYGVTTFSLKYGCVVYSWSESTGYNIIHNFAQTGIWSGSGALLYHSGYLYGMMTNGGAYDLGGIYRVNATGDEYVLLREFTPTSGGAGDGGLVWDDSNNDYIMAYGITNQYGANQAGTIFRINTSKQRLLPLFGQQTFV